MVATLDDPDRENRALEARRRKEVDDELTGIDKQLTELSKMANDLVRATLQGAGGYRSKGRWKRRRIIAHRTRDGNAFRGIIDLGRDRDHGPVNRAIVHRPHSRPTPAYIERCQAKTCPVEMHPRERFTIADRSRSRRGRGRVAP